MVLQSLTKLGRAVKCSFCCSIITTSLLEPDEACLNLIHLMSHAEWVDPSHPSHSMFHSFSNSMNPMSHIHSMNSNCYSILSSVADLPNNLGQ